MFRWHIIRTLIYKEMLRYRYNWGLLVLIFALLVISMLVSISARMGMLPGQGGASVNRCYVFYDSSSSKAQAWAEHLRNHPPAAEYRVEFASRSDADILRLRAQSMAIQLLPQDESWKVRYWYLENAPSGTFPYRDWFVRETHRFLGTQPRLEEETRQTLSDLQRTDPIPYIITVMVVFALYLLSFNLYITSTGEEREKRVMLALLLSPATPAEVMAAKALFYAAASLAVAMAIVLMYRPILLANPLLWSTVIFGSLGYVAMGTLAVSIIRRQTTINTVSLLYLLLAAGVFFVSSFLPIFGILRFFFIDDYLHRQLHLIFSDQAPWWSLANQGALMAITLAWTGLALYVFSRQGMAISRAR